MPDIIDAPPLLELLETTLDEPPAPASPVAPPARTRMLRVAATVAAAAAIAAAAGWLATREPAVAPPPAGLTGFAELYVATYLTAAGDEGAARLRTFYADAPPGAAFAAPDRFVTHVAAIAVRPVAPAYWAVHVAADVLSYDGAGYRQDGLQLYLVGVVESGEGFTATSLPGRIAASAQAPIPATATGVPIDDPAMWTLVEGFLAAYLTGAGDLGAYASAGAGIGQGLGAVFASVAVEKVTGTAMTGNGTLLRVTGVATDPRGATVPIEYHLAVGTEGGVLKVTAIAPGPAAAT